MKNISLKLGLASFFRQRIYGRDSSGKFLKLMERESERERAESVIEDILRWADDGGPIFDPGSTIKEKIYIIGHNQ